MLGGGGGRTRQKYKCKADGCQVTPMGVNLSKHYKVNTDWVLLKELKACVGDAALKKKTPELQSVRGGGEENGRRRAGEQ